MYKTEKAWLLFKDKSFSYWITDKYIFVMLLVFPLLTGLRGYTELTVSKYIFFAAITVIWIAAMLIGKIGAIMSMRVQWNNLVGMLILLYLVFCCISAIFSPFKASVLLGEGRYDGIITILLYVSIFFGVSVFARPKPSYVYAAAISMSINCIIAVLQLLGLNPLYLFPGDYTYYDSGIKYSSVFLGTIGNADLFSAFLCLTLPLVSAYYTTADLRSLWLLPAIAVSSLCLFSCGVSGGMLAIAVCLLVSAPFIIKSGESLRRALEVAMVFGFSLLISFSFKAARGADGISFGFIFSKCSLLVTVLIAFLAVLRIAFNRREFKQKTLSHIFAGLSIGSAVCCLAAVYFWHGTSGTMYELSQTIHGKPEDKFGSSRILIWRNVLKLVPSNFILGGGPGTLPLRLNVSFSRFVAESGKTLSTSVDNAHNEYLGILVNTGAVSLLSYLAAQATSLVKAVKASKHSILIPCLACSLLCYWVQAFFGLGLFIVTPLMWLFWGLLVSEIKNYNY